MTEGSARTKLATVALIIVGFALGFAEFIVIGITPDIAEEYGISLASAGNLVGFFAISYAVSTPIIVLSTGRFRRFPLFVTFLAVFNAGNLLAIAAPTYETLLVARVLTAVVSGVLLSTVMTFINDIVSREQSARIISFVYAGFSVANVLGTPVGTLLADAFGIKSAFMAVEAVALIVTVLLLISVPRSGSTDVSSRVRDQLVILKDRRIILVLIMKGIRHGGNVRVLRVRNADSGRRRGSFGVDGKYRAVLLRSRNYRFQSGQRFHCAALRLSENAPHVRFAGTRAPAAWPQPCFG